MKKRDSEKRKSLGVMPADQRVCVTYYGEDNELLLESYAYEVGFFRFNWHPSLEIMLVIRGGLKAYTEHGIFDMQENDLLVINPNEGHASMLQTPGTIAVVLHISQEYIEQLCGSSNLPVFHCNSTPETRNYASFCMLRSTIASIYDALAEQPEPDRLFVLGQVCISVSLLIREFSNGIPSAGELKISVKQQQTVHSMIKYIDHGFRDKITLKEMADLFDMNLSYTSNFFRQRVGIGFHEYLIRKRLAYAVYLLNNTEDAVLDIALEAGFPDTKAFHLAFKKYFNTSPGRYRMVSKTSVDMNARNLYPVRLDFSHPAVREALTSFLNCPIRTKDICPVKNFTC